MRAKEFIIEGYREALAEFGREADPTEVRAVIDQYKQLVNKNQFRDPREKNIDYWRPKGWAAFSQMVKLKSSDITDSQRKRGKSVGNAIILQDDSEWTVVIPLDKEASVHYGKATEWCTTKPSQPYFENYFYQRNIALIYAIPKDNASTQHVAIALSPTGDVEMFNRADDPINAQQYTQISDLDPNKFIAMSKESTNQQQMKSQREKYDQAISDTKRLLQETPLDPDAIERALKFTKNSQDCYDYIVAYGQEQNKQVAVHPSILVAASAQIRDDQDVAEKIGQYIDFSKIPMGVFKSILASNPNIFTHNYKLLNNEQQSIFATTPASAYNYARHILGRKRFPAGEATIATSAQYSCEYAQMLSEPFPAGEPAIATSAQYSCEYAIVLGKRFPAGESAIATSAKYSFEYASVLGKRFPAGESAIAKDAEISYDYAMMLGKRFLAGEPAIAKDAEMSVEYASMLGKRFPAGEPAVAKNAQYSYSYAMMLGKRFPEGEPAIAKNSQYSFEYASMLGKRFPAGEDAIATSAMYSFEYAQMLGKRFPAGEAAIATDAQYSYSYAMMLNKRFPAGEAAIAKDPYYNNRYIEDIINSSSDNTLHKSTDQPLSLPSNINRNNVRDVFDYVAQQELKIPEAESIIATDGFYSVEYAKLLKKRFPAGEAAIATSAMYSYIYAVTLKQPFPAGEKVILLHDGYRINYIRDILRYHRSQSWEDLIKDTARYSYEYATLLGERFHEGEPAIAANPRYAELYDDAFGTNLAQR